MVWSHPEKHSRSLMQKSLLSQLDCYQTELVGFYLLSSLTLQSNHMGGCNVGICREKETDSQLTFFKTKEVHVQKIPNKIYFSPGLFQLL